MTLYKLLPAIHNGTNIPYVRDFGGVNQLPYPHLECDPDRLRCDEIPEYIEFKQVAVHKRLVDVEIRYYSEFAHAFSIGGIRLAWFIGYVPKRKEKRSLVDYLRS